MNKADLFNEVANVVSTKTEAQAAVDCVFESIGKTLEKGDVVTLAGFGTFKVVKRKARTGLDFSGSALCSAAADRPPTTRSRDERSHQTYQSWS